MPSRPTLSWPVHRDLAQIFASWRQYVSKIGTDAFAVLLVLEALRLEDRSRDTFRYQDLENDLDISPATLRRWLRKLRTRGFLSTTPVPGTNRREARFQIHIPPRQPR